MAFRMPLPRFVSKSTTTVSLVEDFGPSGFSKSAVKDVVLIGMGSYGKVFKGFWNEQPYVLKEQIVSNSSEKEQHLFMKEAKLLRKLKGHSNVVDIQAFSQNTMLLEFVCFTFEKIGIAHESVFNLKQFLIACDSFANFDGFLHVQHFVALDIWTGLEFLHSRNVAHRDMKPENVLISNRHYERYTEDEVPYWWSVRPVVAKLTDFGEARSTLHRTRTITSTNTVNLYRGSPAYMAPEALTASGSTASLKDLLAMDIWSCGMTMFHLLNPNAKFPYNDEVANSDAPVEALRQRMKNRQLPNFLPKYALNRKGVWLPIWNVYMACTDFNSSRRPSAAELLQLVINSHVSVASVIIKDHSGPDTETGSAATHTDSLCTVMNLMIASQVVTTALEAGDLQTISQNVIRDKPDERLSSIPFQASLTVHEAYKLVRSLKIVQELELETVLHATNAQSVCQAVDEFSYTITRLLEKLGDETFAAVYTCRLVTLLVC
jgi:serine/threonine protein kinase